MKEFRNTLRRIIVLVLVCVLALGGVPAQALEGEVTEGPDVITAPAEDAARSDEVAAFDEEAEEDQTVFGEPAAGGEDPSNAANPTVGDLLVPDSTDSLSNEETSEVEESEDSLIEDAIAGEAADVDGDVVLDAAPNALESIDGTTGNDATEEGSGIVEESAVDVKEEPSAEAAPVEPADATEGEDGRVDAGLTAQANNSRSTAKAAKLGKTYSGKISSSEHEDFYRIRLTKKTKVKVTGSFGFRFGWVNFRDANGSLEWYESVGTSEGRSFSSSVTLAKGTHYFTVECWNYTGPYRFKLSGPSSKSRKASVAYLVHRQTYGWEKSWRKNGAVSGTTGESKRLEGIRIKLAGKPVSGGIKYRTHIQGIGWQGWRANGKLSGTTRQSRRLEAIQVRLTGRMAKRYDVWYRVHAQHFGWMGWAKNGRSAGTAGYSYRLEAIQVVLKAKGSKAPSATYKGVRRATKARFKKKVPYPIITARTYETADFKVTMPDSWSNQWNVDVRPERGGKYYNFYNLYVVNGGTYARSWIHVFDSPTANSAGMRGTGSYLGRSKRGKYLYLDVVDTMFRSGVAQIKIK